MRCRASGASPNFKNVQGAGLSAAGSQFRQNIREHCVIKRGRRRFTIERLEESETRWCEENIATIALGGQNIRQLWTASGEQLDIEAVFGKLRQNCICHALRRSHPLPSCFQTIAVQPQHVGPLQHHAQLLKQGLSPPAVAGTGKDIE